MFQNASKWSQSHSPCCDRINERHAYVLQQASDALGGPHTLRSLTALHNQNWQMSMKNHPNRKRIRRRETSKCNQISWPGEILRHGVSLSISQHLSSFLSLIEASAFRLRCTRRCSARGWVAWNQEHRKWQDSARYFRQFWSCASLDRFVFQCPSAILSFAGAVVVQGHILNLPIKKVHVNIYTYIYIFIYICMYIYVCVYIYN